MRTIAILLAAITLYGATAAHADVEIGLVGPFTGPLASFGEQMKHGAEQAVTDINAAGGVNGEKITIKYGDDACDPKQGVVVANRFVSEGVKYVIGPFCSSSGIPAAKVYMEEGVLIMSPAATNPKLTDEGKTYVFRVCGRDDMQGVVIGKYLAKHFAKAKIGVIDDKSAYGKNIADVASNTLAKHGIKPAMRESFNAGEKDYSALVTKLKQANVDIVMIGGYHPEAGLIARQLADAGAKVRMIGGDAIATDEFWSIAGTAGEGMLFSFGPDARKNAVAQKVAAKIRKSGYEPAGYTLYAYGAFQVLTEAMKKAGGVGNVKKVTDALRSAQYNTVLGPLSFDAKGDIKGSGFVIYRWHDGQYKQVSK